MEEMNTMGMSIKEKMEFRKMKKDPAFAQLIPLMLQQAAINGMGEEYVYRKIKQKEAEKANK